MYRGVHLYGYLFSRATQNYYNILGVSSSASVQDIKSAYLTLAKKYHPDLNQGSSERFKTINEAYQVLSDPKSKKEYDLTEGQSFQNSRNQYQERRTERPSPRDDRIYQDLRRMQEESMHQYQSFKARKEHQQRRTESEEELRGYYEGIRSGRYDYSERGGRTRNRQSYNPQYDRSKDSLLGCMGDCVKGAWQFWLGLKSKK